MKLSEEAKKYADSIYFTEFHQVAVDGENERNQIRGAATRSNPNIHQMVMHYVNSTKRCADARIDSYVEAYSMDDQVIDDEDEKEIIEEVRYLINAQLRGVTSTITIPEFRLPGTGEKIPNLDSQIAGYFERLLGEAAIKLKHAKARLIMERRKRARDEKSKLDSSQVNIYGPNFGGIQQGGQHNTQSNTANINPALDAKIHELLGLIEVSTELNPVQKLKAVNDIKTVQQLSRLEPSSEVKAEALSRLDAVTSVISLTADLVSLGMPITQIVRAFFGV